MQRRSGKSSQAARPLKAWLWGGVVRALLVPLVVIQLCVLLLFWGAGQIMLARSAGAVTAVSADATRSAALREAEIIAQRLDTVAALAKVYAEEAARALASPVPEVPPEVIANHALGRDGLLRSLRNDGGSALVYGGASPDELGAQDRVWQTWRLDPLMRSIHNSDAMIAQVLLQMQGPLLRIYPWPALRLDAVQGPVGGVTEVAPGADGGPVWSDAYAVQDGVGWRARVVVPIAAPGSGKGPGAAAEPPGVVGIDVKIDTILRDLRKMDLPGDGHALLLGREGTILAMIPAASAATPDVPVPSAGGVGPPGVGMSRPLPRPDSLPANIRRSPELAALADAIKADPVGDARIDTGSPMIVGWARIGATGWTLLTLTGEASVLTDAAALQAARVQVGTGIGIFLVLTLAGFVLMLRRQSEALARGVAVPLAEVEEKMARIGAGERIGPGQRYAVAEVQALNDQLVVMGEKMQTAGRAKTAFVSSISHELRTPLNAILGFSELLVAARGEKLEGERIGQVEEIHRAGRQLLKLVEGVIELSRINRGEVKPVLAPLEVMPVLRQAMRDLRPELNGSVRLVVVEPETPLPRVQGDAAILRAILMQLVSNAAKYSRAGGTVRVSLAEQAGGSGVGASAVGAGRHLAVSVVDGGVGIPAAMRGRLFTPFDRLGQENGRIGGAGLGLTISRRLAELAGAGIDVESDEGRGSTFTLRLPLA